MADLNENLTTDKTNAIILDIFKPHELSEAERIDLFVKYDHMLNTGSPRFEDVFVILYNYFNENQFSPYFIEKYFDTYWLLFVKIGWRLLPRLQSKYTVDLVARTLPYAAAQYIDVKKEFSEILISYSDEDAKLFYTQIKQKLLSLDYPISFNEYGKNITISQLIKKINESGVEKDLSRFGMFADIQKAFFPDIPDDYEAAKKDALRRTMEFIEMMYFFAKDSDVGVFKGTYFDKINNQIGVKMSKEVKAELGAKVLAEYFSGEEESEDLIEGVGGSFNEKPFLAEKRTRN